MAQKTRFFKTTKGFNAEVIVAKNVAYTTDATIALFVDNAVEGEIGVYNYDTGALIGFNTPITAGTKFTILQKRDGGILRTTPAIYGEGTVKKTAYVAPVKQIATVTFAGVIGTAFNIGDEISVQVIETTPGAEPFPRVTYDYVVKAGDTVTSIATALKNKINNLNALENQDGRAFVTASNAAGVLSITAMYFGSSFSVALPGKSYEIGTVVARATPYKQGSGYYEDVASVETEGNIFDGVTTQYPGEGFAPGDFGSPTRFSAEGLFYDTYNVTTVKNEKSPTPINQHHHYWDAILFVPNAGGPAVAISTIFGFTAPV